MYARNWRGTAESHFANGLYHWLAEQIAPRNSKRILDIGCGSGHGLAALRDVLGDGVEIMGIDENRACLETCRETLRQKSKVDSPIVTRMSVMANDGGYVQESAPFVISGDGPVVLIEADVCNDPYLCEALRASGPFDLVTNWLTGVHMLRQSNAAVQAAGITTDGAHRLYVQNATYELADAVLRAGGALQIADRGQTPSSDLLMADVHQAHMAQAEPTTLNVSAITYRPYEEPISQRTPMRFTQGLLGVTPTNLELSVISVVSEKT